VYNSDSAVLPVISSYKCINPVIQSKTCLVSQAQTPTRDNISKNIYVNSVSVKVREARGKGITIRWTNGTTGKGIQVREGKEMRA
jgi:hypothetical protein